MIAIKSCYHAVQIELEDVQAETVWASISLKDHKKLIIGAFYRQPDHRVVQLEQLEKGLTQIRHKLRNNPDCTMILAGDFNAGGIDWETGCVDPTSDKKAVNEKVLQILSGFDLVQMQREPTRENRILDLFCLNKPGLLKATHVLPGISDHRIILADCDLKPVIHKKPPRKIHLWSKADWEKLKEQARQFKTNFLASYTSRSVDENYKEFKAFIDNILDKLVPSKMSSKQNDPPWMTQELKCMSNKKQRMFNRVKCRQILQLDQIL